MKNDSNKAQISRKTAHQTSRGKRVASWMNRGLWRILFIFFLNQTTVIGVACRCQHESGLSCTEMEYRVNSETQTQDVQGAADRVDNAKCPDCQVRQGMSHGPLGEKQKKKRIELFNDDIRDCHAMQHRKGQLDELLNFLVSQ